MNSFLDHYFSSQRIRFHTREINIGGLLLGGTNPIRIQSMTNTDTNDIENTVNQCIRLADAGCELIRITAQGEREAQNLALIKKELRARGYQVPLIADIHFNPKAAEIAAGIVEKVRINPGNYSDKNISGKYAFTEQEYAIELERIAEKINPLLSICKQNGTAIRIGSNHGSLSNRIINRYGDTPEGMVESALEFARICRMQGFQNLVLSMKSSNVKVMIYATRLLAHRMMAENMDFPIHLGVTEAGDGEDGILKSAVGIGALLEDGIGDTLRVSLTGDPMKEIPVARMIASRYNFDQSINPRIEQPLLSSEKPLFIIPDYSPDFNGEIPIDPFTFQKRESHSSGPLGGSQLTQVLTRRNERLYIQHETHETGIELDQNILPGIFRPSGGMRQMRGDFCNAIVNKNNAPSIISWYYKGTDPLEFMVNASIDIGSLLIDGYGEAICLDAPGLPDDLQASVAFGILQATRTRITRTEYISCPSCGRTLFDIESTLEKVKSATSHLVGLKIAVMGCIVNGPGEMADADFGYVGAGKGKVSLYKGKEVVMKGIPEESAVDELIKLIRSDSRFA
ncbi:MAG: (E)-4-hydroxy-3-methylbut-2-enyl-diphosphate synthase [Bacteroidales bacterium]|nr:(E)-4-hydroxy-3-methylbut-2-enyl-diphosphate synthase [Bacteroidales bacterium]